MVEARNIYMPLLCGNASSNDAFWDYELTVNTSLPDITPCFANTVLTWIPTGSLWLASLLYVPYLYTRRSIHTCTQFSGLNLTKTITGVALIIAAVLMLVWTEASANLRTPASVSAWAIKLASMVLVTALMRYEYIKGMHTSGVMLFFWLVLTCSEAMPFRHYILQWLNYAHGVQLELKMSVCYSCYLFLVLVEFVCTLFADLQAREPEHRSRQYYSAQDYEREPLLGQELDRKLGQKETPENTTPFWSKFTFLWITGDVFRSFKRTVTFEDLYDIRKPDKCSSLVPDFYKYYYGQEDSEPFYSDGTGPDILTQIPKRTFFKAVMRSVGPQLLLGMLFHTLAIAMRIVNPQLLRLLIMFSASGDPYTWKGVFLSFVLLVTCLVMSLCMHNFMALTWKAGMQVRTIANAVVYRKALRLSGASRKATTVGEIVNLMSVDSQKLQDAFVYAPMLWELIAMVPACLYFMWDTVGPAAIGGLVVAMILFPVNGILLANKVRKLQYIQMVAKDQRLRQMNEILAGMKILKLYAWEPSFMSKLLEKRERELWALKRANIVTSISNLGLYLCPYLMSLSVFAVYVLLSPSNILDADKAFVTRTYIGTLNFLVSMLPLSVTFVGQGMVSIKRINKFLNMEELKEDYVEKKSYSMGESVNIENGSFTWEENGVPTLNSINMQVQPGELISIVGHVGSGKSSLIAALLGEMNKINGRVKIKGSVSYVPQQAWIQNATVRDNIIFGKAFHKKKYDVVLEACALLPDLKILGEGDLTEIGEKGINLSGGQKQRISLARAVYQDEDIILLDDPLSAVDAHVGKHIFDNVIGPRGLLRRKTRVFVTHSLSYLPQTDQLVVLQDGQISESGNYEQLLENNGAFAEFVRTYLAEAEHTLSQEEKFRSLMPPPADLLSRAASTEFPSSHAHRLQVMRRSYSYSPINVRIQAMKTSLQHDSWETMSGSSHGDYPYDEEDVVTRRRGSAQTRSGKQEVSTREAKFQETERKKLVQVETTQVGLVRWSVIWTFIKAAGLPYFFVLLLFHICYIAVSVITNLWLSVWTEDSPVNGTMPSGQTNLRLGVYGALGGIQAVLVLIVMVSAAFGCVSASRNLHWKLLNRIMHAPMAFFDTTPLGRIMNRFSKDLDSLDTNIPLFLRGWLFCVAMMISCIIVISYTTPIFLVAAVPLGVLFFVAQRVYNTYMGQLKRIDAVKRSPIYAHFDESITGAISIRAYGRESDFVAKCDALIDQSQRPWYHIVIAQRWSGLWMEVLGALVVFFAALFSVLSRDSLTPGAIGMSISYGLQIITLLNTMIRCAAEMETHMVSVERIDEYCDVPQEAKWRIPGVKPPENWPVDGTVTFLDYSTRYRPGLDLVLSDATFMINKGEKVGIVGRTGAGKSSMALALFRIIEAVSGSIMIDDVKIDTLGLHDVRSKITVIPQDPLVFSGTLRMNLDPFNQYSDEQIWKTLGYAHLRSFVEPLEKGLMHDCGEGGEGLSVGQRQLVCLARALLRMTKILVLDEATAAIDMETDALIQETIRTQFRHCTVLTVAHRLNTIMDYDRIMVLDKGTVKEFDTPGNLLDNRHTIFYGLAKDAGLV